VTEKQRSREGKETPRLLEMFGFLNKSQEHKRRRLSVVKHERKGGGPQNEKVFVQIRGCPSLVCVGRHKNNSEKKGD